MLDGLKLPLRYRSSCVFDTNVILGVGHENIRSVSIPGGSEILFMQGPKKTNPYFFDKNAGKIYISFWH